MRTIRLCCVLLLLSALPAGLSAQVPVPGTGLAVPPSQNSLQAASFGPLALAARTSTTNGIMLAGGASAPMKMYQWRRGDWEFGRGWIGSIIGMFYGWVADMAVHYQTDFSKANWLWNEGLNERDQVINGEVVYNILFYNGLTPLFATRGVRHLSPLDGDFLLTYLTSLVGSLGGMAYWTHLNELHDWRGFVAFTGLSTLGAWIGNRIWR
jgi:hypothetical protein